jgi:hypothetical protein
MEQKMDSDTKSVLQAQLELQEKLLTEAKTAIKLAYEEREAAIVRQATANARHDEASDAARVLRRLLGIKEEAKPALLPLTDKSQ